MKWILLGVVVLGGWWVWNRYAANGDSVSSLKTRGMDFSKGIN